MVDGAPALVFVDTETTGLDPARHEVYEIALEKTNDSGDLITGHHIWIAPRQLQNAEPGALQVGRFYERFPERGWVSTDEERFASAREIAAFTEGCYLVGANPAFDAGFLNAFLRESGVCPAWHHRLIDIESLAVGLCIGEDDAWRRPQSLSEICRVLNVKREGHEARGDCEALRLAYFKLIATAEERWQRWLAAQGRAKRLG